MAIPFLSEAERTAIRAILVATKSDAPVAWVTRLFFVQSPWKQSTVVE